MTDHPARLDTSQPDPVPSDEGSAAAYDLDALRLLRLTNLRRLLRTLCGLLLLALPLWAIYSLTMEAVYDRASEQFWRIDDETGPGFVVILIAVGVTIALLIGTRWLGRTGRVAATLVRIVGRAAVPRVPDGVQTGRAVVARLRRHPFVRPWLLGVLLFATVLTVVAANSAWPAWQGNHGHGGLVVTIGEDASLASSTPSSVRGAGRVYLLATPRGTAIAESGRPAVGQRWTVARDVFGNLRAYRVGGLDYLTALLLLAMALLFLVAGLGAQGEVVRRERQLRRSAGHPDLAADVAALAGGERPELLAGKADLGVLGLQPLAGRDPRRLLRRRRLISGTAGVLVAGGLVALLVVQQVGLLTAPPDHRDVHLPYIASAGWNPEATAYYANTDGATELLRDAAGTSKAGEISAARTFHLDRAAPAGSELQPATADVTVARIGSTDPQVLVSGWHASRLHVLGGTDVPDLPAGWSGLYRAHPGGAATVEIMGAADGVCVEIEISDEYVDAHGAIAHYPQSALTSWAGSLAAAFVTAGLHRVDQDTARPAHL